MAVGELMVEGVEWEDFAPWFASEWQQGEHVALVGPTGEGKTTVAAHLLLARKWVMACDPKGGDGTLAQLEGRGFQRITQWPPPREIRQQIQEGKPARLIVGDRIRSRSERPKLRALLERALDGAFEDGGWTVYVDELQLAADRRFMNLGAPIEENLIAARDRGVSMVTSYQRPANVPRTASDQSTWLIVFYTRDVDVVGRLAEMMGRPKAEVRGAISELRKHCVLIVNRSPRLPMLVTIPPPLR